MSTRFKGHKTGFNPKGNNEMLPNEMGPPATKFGGRGALPEGALKRYPGPAGDIGGSNRKAANSAHGAGGGDGVTYRGRTAFNGNRSKK